MLVSVACGRLGTTDATKLTQNWWLSAPSILETSACTSVYEHFYLVRKLESVFVSELIKQTLMRIEEVEILLMSLAFRFQRSKLDSIKSKLDCNNRN